MRHAYPRAGGHPGSGQRDSGHLAVSSSEWAAGLISVTLHAGQETRATRPKAGQGRECTS